MSYHKVEVPRGTHWDGTTNERDTVTGFRVHDTDNTKAASKTHIYVKVLNR